MSDTRKKLTLDELKELPEYQRLTQKQQLFVATYCEGGLANGCYNAPQATMTAYQCKSMETARIMSYSLLANIRIVAVLNRHFNATPTEEFLAMLDRAINNKKLTVAQLSALRLKCAVLGLGNKIPDFTTVPKEDAFQGAIADAVAASKKGKVKTPAGVKEPKPSEFSKTKF